MEFFPGNYREYEEDKRRRLVLQIRRVAVFPEDAFNQNFDLRPSAFAKRPVDGDAFAYPGSKFCRDHFEVALPMTSKALLLAASAS